MSLDVATTVQERPGVSWPAGRAGAGSPIASARAVCRALRPHQWVKNALVFVPLISAHQIFDAAAVGSTLVTFAAFCLCASGIYVVNDLLDIDADRAHPTKRHRPFAAGELPVGIGWVMGPALSALSFVIALAGTSWQVAAVLAAYAGVSTGYSYRIKREPVADVFVLTALYVLRIFAGALAGSVPLSTWFLGFALFLFLSLAFVKRYTELSAHGVLPGRGYSSTDATWVHGTGVTAGHMAAVVLALYVNSPEVSALYHRPHALWVLCPLLLFWLSRVWFRAGRGLLDDDPVVDTLRDPVSYAAGLVGAGVLLFAL